MPTEDGAGAGYLLAGAGVPDVLAVRAQQGVAGHETVEGGALVTPPPADLAQRVSRQGLPQGVADAGGHLHAFGEHGPGPVAVPANALGCRDLWRVKTLPLRRAFGRLTSEQAAELAGAAPADLRTGRWFRWLWVAGFAGVLAWFLFFVVPVAVTVIEWAVTGLLLGPFDLRFWYSLLCTALLLGPEVLAVFLAVRECARRARAGTTT
ncbi:hypothetical protein [Sphaerimonospora mesophila]|uniref:hypothetical protein n=1 Tax=Sphaerimonospora mesophila TaxID=37483 RepID=UPI0006E127C1